MSRTAKWTMAILVSLAAHAGAAVLMLPREEEAMIAGGAPIEVAVVGDSFRDTIEAGSPEEDAALTPLDEQTDAVQPAETEIAAASPLETPLAPEATPSEIAPESTEPVSPEALADVAPSEADVLLPADAVPPLAAEDPEIVASLPPAEVVPLPRPEPPRPAPAPPEPAKVAEAPPKPKQADSKPDRATRPTPARPKRGEKGAGGGARDQGAAGRSRDRPLKHSQRRRWCPRGDARQCGAVQLQGQGPGSGEPPGKPSRTQEPDRHQRHDAGRLCRHPWRRRTGVRLTRSTGSPELDAAIVSGIKGLSFPSFPAGYSEPTWAFTMPIRFR